MEPTGCSSSAPQNDSSEGSHDTNNSLTGKEAFVNHAEIAWNQMRKEWVGDQSKKVQRPPKVSIKCLAESYDDMLFSKEPFCPPIPLAEMISYFVKIWEEEGLFEICTR